MDKKQVFLLEEIIGPEGNKILEDLVRKALTSKKKYKRASAIEILTFCGCGGIRRGYVENGHGYIVVYDKGIGEAHIDVGKITSEEKEGYPFVLEQNYEQN